MHPLKIIVIGAGIGGLTSAIACRRAGYDVEVYDRIEKLRPSGGGITLWPNGVKALEMLGFGDKIASLSGCMNYIEYRSREDEFLSRVNLESFVDRVGQRPYPLSRWDLQQMLLKDVGIDNIHLGMKCIAVEQNSHSVTAIFEDGTRTTGNLLIGADGIHSQIRSHVTEQDVLLRYAGYVNWNGLIPAWGKLHTLDKWIIYVGDNKRVSIMPIGNGQISYVFGAPMPKGTVVASKERKFELENIFADWHKVSHLIQNLEHQKINRIEINDIHPLKKLVRGRVALLGDAGHPSTPALGQGACQAMEDAIVLIRYLIESKVNVENALKHYENKRKGRTTALLLQARKRTNMFYGKNSELTKKWYLHLKERKEAEVVDYMAKIFFGSPFD